MLKMYPNIATSLPGDDVIFDVITNAIFRRRQTFAKGRHYIAGQLLKF